MQWWEWMVLWNGRVKQDLYMQMMANSEEDMKVIMEKVNECVVEYGLKVNEKKSKVVCINGEVGRRRWMMGDCCI